MSDDYKYRPELTKENQEKLFDIRKKLGLDGVSLNGVANVLIGIGSYCLDRSMTEIGNNIKIRLEDKFDFKIDEIKNLLQNPISKSGL